MNWSDITNTIGAMSAFFSCCVAVAQTIVVTATLIYASRQIHEARREQLLSAIWKIFDTFDSHDTREARGYLYVHCEAYKSLESDGDSKLKALSKEAHEKAQRVSNTFDRVGYVVAKELVPSSLILDGYYQIIARCWLILKPYIEATRSLRNQRDYQKYFQSLGEMAVAKYLDPSDALRQVHGTIVHSEDDQIDK